MKTLIAAVVGWTVVTALWVLWLLGHFLIPSMAIGYALHALAFATLFVAVAGHPDAQFSRRGARVPWSVLWRNRYSWPTAVLIVGGAMSFGTTAWVVSIHGFHSIKGNNPLGTPATLAIICAVLSVAVFVAESSRRRASEEQRRWG